ncbi:hypothetical protein pRL70049 (plasmid) [Rhizobium johnstonii 3841]|uniref:Uncharacterized protein n=1 Tax=Rhizobium johnstonii (strain DSM 114642 / LMG 32736 / 3841) TaxID=216596 RepID=Q1M9W7_RHIJ3|nr:hypothetical protein pRL70049 [Rhizobium johnstonii 3841]
MMDGFKHDLFHWSFGHTGLRFEFPKISLRKSLSLFMSPRLSQPRFLSLHDRLEVSTICIDCLLKAIFALVFGQLRQADAVKGGARVGWIVVCHGEGMMEDKSVVYIE